MSEKGCHSSSDRYLSAQEVCERYQLSHNWLYHCKRLRKYARRAGRWLRYRESDLEKFELEGNFMRQLEGFPEEAAETDDLEVEGHKWLTISGFVLQCRIRVIKSYILKHLVSTTNIISAVLTVTPKQQQLIAGSETLICLNNPARN